MSKTIFEMIINKDIPSLKIYEDDEYIAFLDVNPKQKGHTLLVPKIKQKNILEESKKVKESILEVAIMISKILKKKLNATGIKIIINNGKSSGQIVFHTHFHLIPYYDKKVKPINNEEVLNKILN
ncbi:MAG: HIT family protein [Mycoplasmataceae bacterium]|nr:HIT family protein [Mycoplasmataceae bacterium]